MSLQIKNLSVSTKAKQILTDISLTINSGELHVIMGPNGSGKSTLVNTLAGHPNYEITAGEIILDEIHITKAKPQDRACAGLLLSMQSTPAIEGVSIMNMLRMAKEAISGEKIAPMTWYQTLSAKAKELGIDPTFLQRSVNVGFSGGEKKRLELLQIAVLEPKYVLLDETDAGLDIDALSIVRDMIIRLQEEGKGIIFITHYTKLFESIDPTAVYIMKEGKIVATGGKELIQQVEAEGYLEK